MRYEFQIRLTDEEYTDFNVFHLARSPYGTKLRRGLRWPMVVIFALAAGLRFWTSGVNAVSVLYALLLVGAALLMICMERKSAAWTTKRTIRAMKKTGKMPYSPEATVEFTEDGIQEITPEGRMERRWESVERLCILGDKYWYLYQNNTSCFILPVEQLKAQTDLGEFLRFLEAKCPQVDRFEK